jgi:hypothetical protein
MNPARPLSGGNLKIEQIRIKMYYNEKQGGLTG